MLYCFLHLFYVILQYNRYEIGTKFEQPTMKVSVKLYTNKETKQGFPVTVFFRSPTIRKRVSLGWYFKLDDWDFEKQMPIPAADDFDFVYPKLLNFRSEIKNLLFKGETNIDAFLAIFNNSYCYIKKINE